MEYKKYKESTKEGLLSREEETELILKAQAGDKDASDELVLKNQRLVLSIAKKYTESVSLDFDDLYMEGIIGLMKAIGKFDTTKGYKFSTYATFWIRQAITRSVSDYGKTIRVPVYIQEAKNRINKVSEALKTDLGREPSVREIHKKLHINTDIYSEILKNEYFEILKNLCITGNADDEEIKEVFNIIVEDFDFSETCEVVLSELIKYMSSQKKVPSQKILNTRINLSEKKISEFMNTTGNLISLDCEADEDGNKDIGDFIECKSSSVEDIYFKKSMMLGLEKAINETFPDTSEEGKRTAEIIKRRWGICGYKKQTLEEIGADFNITRERVRQIEKSALGLSVRTKESITLRNKIIKYCNILPEEFN